MRSDWSPRHIMMDAGALFPEGFHPVKIWMDPTGAHRAQQLPRQQGKVKYYFTDVQYEIPYKDLLYMPPDDKKSVMDRAKHHDPEILDHIHFSAFTSDLWNIGRLLRVQLYDVRVPISCCTVRNAVDADVYRNMRTLAFWKAWFLAWTRITLKIRWKPSIVSWCGTRRDRRTLHRLPFHVASSEDQNYG